MMRRVARVVLCNWFGFLYLAGLIFLAVMTCR